jgi:hypothetical protein
MKSIKVFLMLLLTVAMCSCAHFHDEPTKSVWSSGLWILPWVVGLAALVCFAIAYFSSKSNSDQQVDLGTPNAHTEDNTGNVPIYKISFFWGGVFLTIVDVAIIVGVNLSK